MHIRISVVYMCNTDMWEVRNRGNYIGGECFSGKLKICLESHWCALSSVSRAGRRCQSGNVFEQQSVVVHLSKLRAVVQEACCHGGKWLRRFLPRSQVGANPSAICLLRRRLLGVVCREGVDVMRAVPSANWLQVGLAFVQAWGKAMV